MIVERTCIDCKKTYKLEVEPEDYQAWKNGMLTQRALPYLTADEREILITNICGKCFDAFTDEVRKETK